MKKRIIGIDLGTTFSAVAYVDDQGFPRVIPNADGNSTTPSVVWIEPDRITVGETAMNQWIMDEEHVIRWIKRAMGNPHYRFQGKSAIEISAEILKSLKKDAEIELGEAVSEAVITCPAYFNSLEIENTQQAGELAGLHVREIVKEPTAAAVYYGIDHMKHGEITMVCDLGGGTFDATILTLDNDNRFNPLATQGDRQLGGHDWTQELLSLVVEKFLDETGYDPTNDLLTGQILYEDCEKAKRAFQQRERVSISCKIQDALHEVIVERKEFEDRTEPLIQQMLLWCEEALLKAQLTWKDIDRILLVGGSSRLLRVSPALFERSGIKPILGSNPDLMVAYGAAILGSGKVRSRKISALMDKKSGGLVEVNYKRIIARNMGTRVVVFDNDKPRIENSLLIPHSTESPVSKSRDDYEISSDGQVYFELPIVEFEDEDNWEVQRNYKFSCLPGAKRGDRIKVTFDYSISGVVTADAIDLRTGQQLQREDKGHYEDPDLTEIIQVKFKPRWIIFAVDTSGSMSWSSKMVIAKDALRKNIQDLISIGGDNCRIGLVSFNSEAEVLCKPTSDLSTLKKAIEKLEPTGLTAMDKGILLALSLITDVPPGTDREIVLVTDGMPDDKELALSAALNTQSKGIKLMTLGLGKSDVDESFLKQMTPNTLVIDKINDMTQAVTTLLTQSVQNRKPGHGGLTEQ